MTGAETPQVLRDFSRTDATRMLITVGILAVVAVSYWYTLPALQSLTLPSARTGHEGPWVVRPIGAFHFGAMTVLTAVTVPLVLLPVQRKWARADVAFGTRYDPFHGRPGKRRVLLVKGSFLMVVYAAGLFCYLFSWERVGPEGIQQRLPWTTLNHSFQDIESLETVPEGERSDSISRSGPWYSIKFKSGRSITLSEANEGCTRAELSAMTAFIADRSGLPWVRRGDSRAE
jgi:hypothetical protein